jgi:alpha-beta hydrolase superfamily lysophospholipase
MESISSDDVHVRMPDDTVLVVRKFSGHERTGVLIIPDHGKEIGRYEALAHVLHSMGCNVFLLELRGHGLSEGEWDERSHRSDIKQIISALQYHARHQSLYLVAEGTTAAMLLKEAPQANGMVLLDPAVPVEPVHVTIPVRIVLKGDAMPLLKRVFGPVVVMRYDAKLRWLSLVQESILQFQKTATIARPIRHPAVRKGIAG